MSGQVLLVLLREKAVAPHSSTLAWKIPWTEEPGGLPSLESHRVANAEWCTKFAAAVQNAIQCTVSSKMREKELLPRHHWTVFTRGWIELNPIRNQN